MIARDGVQSEKRAGLYKTNTMFLRGEEVQAE
jgi:hypothetical protein